MLVAGPQAELEHGSEGEHVRLSNVGIGLDEAHVRGKVVDRVDPPGKTREGDLAQAEPLRASVAGNHAEARGKFILPDLGQLQGIADPSEPVLGAVCAHQAVHDQALVLLQQRTQEEAPGEAGGPGEQDLANLVGGYRRGRRLAPERRINDAAQRVHVPPALRGQTACERRHRFVNDARFGQRCLTGRR